MIFSVTKVKERKFLDVQIQPLRVKAFALRNALCTVFTNFYQKIIEIVQSTY